jgi:hypothetical protein
MNLFDRISSAISPVMTIVSYPTPPSRLLARVGVIFGAKDDYEVLSRDRLFHEVLLVSTWLKAPLVEDNFHAAFTL